MKNLSFLFLLILILAGCSSKETSEYQLDNLKVSGEYLFDGPNTLQGQPEISLEDIAEKLNTDIEKIKSVTVREASISFSPDSLRNDIESALVQWVSDDLELVSVATKNPLPMDAVVPLEVNQEQEILPYFKDETSTLVVDANIIGDMDYLEATLNFKLNVEYTN